MDRISFKIDSSSTRPSLAALSLRLPDAKIAEQTKTGVFPIRLKPDDWTSGEIVWLLDVIAPSREMATTVQSRCQAACS